MEDFVKGTSKDHTSIDARATAKRMRCNSDADWV